jgi:hypothetical protein
MSTHEHVCGACGRPDTPRVWRSGDPGPGGDVRAVLDSMGYLWTCGRFVRKWSCDHEKRLPWTALLGYGPLVEVTLPEPVTE